MRAMRRLDQILNGLELKDLGLFTWEGGSGNNRLARLDRFLVSVDGENCFENLTQKLLLRPVSDHFAIILAGGELQLPAPIPFRFENMWLKADNFDSLVEEWWKSFKVRGAASYVISAKLKSLKVKLKIWNKEVFGKVEDKKKEAPGNMASLDAIAAQRMLTSDEFDRKTEALRNLRDELY